MTDTTTVVDLARLPRFVDISCVQAFHTQQDIEQLAERACDGDYVAAHVLPDWLPLLRSLLNGSNTLAGCPISFPAGGQMTKLKLDEAHYLIDAGVEELDVVVNIGRLRSGFYDAVTRELEEVVRLVDGRAELRTILEVGYLSDDQITAGSRAVVAAGAPWVKTATGWSGIATTVHHVEVIAAAVNGRAKLKAAGGIRDLDVVREMVRIGVTRFGMNSDVAMRMVAETSTFAV